MAEEPQAPVSLLCPHCGSPRVVVKLAATVVREPRQLKLRVECLECHQSCIHIIAHRFEDSVEDSRAQS